MDEIPLIPLIKCIKIGYTHWFDHQNLVSNLNHVKETSMLGTGSVLNSKHQIVSSFRSSYDDLS